MGQNSLIKSPKREEQLVPDFVIDDFFTSSNDNLSDFKCILGIKQGGNEREGVMSSTYDDEINWNHMMEWDEFSISQEDQHSGVCSQEKSENREGELVNLTGNIKSEIWEVDEDEDREEDDEKKMRLNLSLNYQEVMDAWSDRGPCRAHDFANSASEDNVYMGEVPVMEEAKTNREASVLKYKKKRQNRLFCRKIRYQVRKLNADKRPRLKGRFVKRES